MTCFPPFSDRPATIAITGGIGSGKSAVCRYLEATGAPIFYADDEAKRIIRTDPVVKAALRQLVGEAVYDETGQLVKSVLAAFLCKGKAYSQQVDAIVHPRVGEAWQAFVADHQAYTYIYMECAILFETGFDRFVDYTLGVHCPLEERIRRVMQRDGVERATVLRWMALQWDDESVRSRCTATLLSDHIDNIPLRVAELGLVGRYFPQRLSATPAHAH